MYKNQDGIQILVVSLGIVLIILGCLPPVNSIEVEAEIVGPGGLKQHPVSILEPMPAQRPATWTMDFINIPLWVDLWRRRPLFIPFLHGSLGTVQRSGG